LVRGLTVYNHTKFQISKLKVHSVVSSSLQKLDLSVISLEINFMDSEQIEVINVQYLKHHFSTDIITFSYSENKKLLDGEIFISLEDALKNAKLFNVLFENEIARLIIHGILHMIGYDDIEPMAKRIMKRKENELVESIWSNSLKGIVKL